VASVKVLIYHSGETSIAEQLRQTITSHFSYDVQVTDEIQSPLDSVDPHRRHLLFFLFDLNSAGDQLTCKDHVAHNKIAVIHDDGSRETDIDTILDPFDDFLFTPLNKNEVIGRINRLLGNVPKDEIDATKKNILQKLGMGQVIGQDMAFQEVISKIRMVADTDVTVLLSGETGVGKEVCARAIHYLSNRSDKPFIPVNCGAIPSNLVENELFGHSKGAYTDARNRQLGVIAEAEGGTLFLDEIDALGLEAQSKLLRMLQDKTYRPLGQTKTVQADVRILVAANVDLIQKVREGSFRQDLYYRFSVPLHLPPLRERKEDIPLLANHFLKKLNSDNAESKKTLSSTALQKLLIYDWPGNIRELENIIQQANLMAPGAVIPPECINIPVLSQGGSLKDLTFTEAKSKVIRAFEKDYISRLLIDCNGNITHAAERARKDRSDFSKLVKKYNLKAETFEFSRH
jgi:DNA-binding NtrC family response regulator